MAYYSQIIGRLFTAIKELEDKGIKIDTININPYNFGLLKSILSSRIYNRVIAEGPTFLHYEDNNGNFIRLKTEGWTENERYRTFTTLFKAGTGESYLVYDFYIKTR
jgi:hypothetical protein